MTNQVWNDVMKKLNDKEKNVVRNKIEEIQSIMSFLSDEYGINSAFLNIRRNALNGVIDFDSMLTSQNASSDILKFFTQRIIDLIDLKEEVPNLLRQNYNLVRCLDNSGVEHYLEKDTIYIVKETICENNKKLLVRLHHPMIPDDENSFSHLRFEKIYLQSINN